MKNYLLMGVFLVSAHMSFASELTKLLALGNRLDAWHTNYCVENKASIFLETVGSKTFARATREYNRCSDAVRNVIWNKTIAQKDEILAATLSLISLDAGVRQNALSQMDDIFNYPEVRKKFCEEMPIGKALEWYAYVDGKNVVTRREFRLQQNPDALQKKHVFRFKIAKEKDKDCFVCMTKEDVFCQLTPEALIALEPQTRSFFNTFESKGQRCIAVKTETDGISRILLTKISNDRGNIENDYGSVSKKACKGILQLAEKGYLGVDPSDCLVECKYEERLSKIRAIICHAVIPLITHYFARQHFRMIESPEGIAIEKTNKRLEALELAGEGPYVKHASKPLLKVDQESVKCYSLISLSSNTLLGGFVKGMLQYHLTKKRFNFFYATNVLMVGYGAPYLMNCIPHFISYYGSCFFDSRAVEFLSFCGYLGALYHSWQDTGVKEETIPLKDTMHKWVTIH